MGKSLNKTVKHNYFNRWSYNMAYIVGFITADGEIRRDNATLAIELQQKDKSILNFILKEISPNTIIKTTKHKDKKGKITSYYRLIIYSPQIIQSLKKYNLFPNKTGKHKLNFKIPKKYFPHYLRGFFDGDGCVYLRRGRAEASLVCKSKQYLLKLRKLTNNLGFLSTNKYKITTWFMGMYDSIKFYSIIYNNKNFCLKRKKYKFDYFYNKRKIKPLL